ncbi:hypothetical protein Q5752_006431 [Cryptotrichosporon argae]
MSAAASSKSAVEAEATSRRVEDSKFESPEAAGSDAEVDSDDSDDLDAVQPVARAQRSEGTAEALKPYAPPPGLEPLASTAPAPFDYDSLSKLANKPGVQLWAVRVPADFKPERLASLSVKPTPAASGSLTYKSTTYTLRAVAVRKPAPKETMANGVAHSTGKEVAAGGLVDALVHKEADDEGGEEMEGLKLLVPENGTGKLVISPMPISQHLVLVPILPPASGSLDFSSLAEPSASGTSSTKRKQPREAFRFRNRAYGFDTPGPSGGAGAAFLDNDSNDESVPVLAAATPKPKKEKKSKHEGEVDGEGKERKKKRKSEAGESHKKRKKVKE